MNKKYLSIGAIVIVVLVVIAVLVLNIKNTPPETLYNCTFSDSDNIDVVDGFVGKMFVSELTDNFSFKDENSDSPTRTFSINELKEYRTSGLAEDVFYVVRNSEGGGLGKIIGADLQVCDINNKAKNVSMINNSSAYVISMTMYMHGSLLPTQTGTYRLDGVVEVDGQKYLLARIEGVELTK